MELLIFCIVAIVAAYFVGGKDWILTPVDDFLSIFSEKGQMEIVKQRQDEHFFWYFGAAFLAVCIGFNLDFLQFNRFYWFEFLVFFTACGFILAYIIERERARRGGKFANGKDIVPTDFKDVRFSAYGAGIGGAMGYGFIITILSIIN